MRIKFQVIDWQTKEIKGIYSTKKRARLAVDRFDNEFGGYRHSIIEVTGECQLIGAIRN